MSSTKNNYLETNANAYYKTPQQPIVDFLKEFILTGSLMRDGISILDCCAGGSNEDEMSYPPALRAVYVTDGDTIDTIDIREDSKASIIGDYLNIDCKNKYDLIITNPPFNIALDIIQKALDDVKDGGYVVMLLRLNFFGSKGRFRFWQENMAKYCFVHSKRISFTKGATDSIEYTHMVWQKGHKPEFCKLKVI